MTETNAELMASVLWLASDEAGMALPPEFLSPVADAIRLVQRQAVELEEMRNADAQLELQWRMLHQDLIEEISRQQKEMERLTKDNETLVEMVTK